MWLTSAEKKHIQKLKNHEKIMRIYLGFLPFCDSTLEWNQKNSKDI